MKYHHTLPLALIIVLCLSAGCGSTSSGSSAPETSAVETTLAETSAPEDDAAESETASSDPAETASENDTAETEAAAEDTGNETVSKGASLNGASKSTRKMTDIATGSILPNSSKKTLKLKDISGLTPYQLRIARNEIFARHGRMFNDTALSMYFFNKTWYEASLTATEFDEKSDSILNKYEKANIKLIQKQEAAVKKNYYANFKTTWKTIRAGAFTSELYGDNTSEYSFLPVFSSAKDCGDYYEIPCQIDRPAVLEQDLAVGSSTTLCCNDLTNESVTLTRVSDEEIQGNNNSSYYLQDGVLFDYYGSDDMIYFPYYVGTIRVKKDAQIGSVFDPQTLSGSFDEYSGWSFNGVNFDSKGYATALIDYGD